MKKLFFGSLFAGLLLLASQEPQAGMAIFTQDFSAVRAFPNPWRSNRDGALPVTIDNLPTSSISTLKIYTIAGEHIATRSGTQAVQWNLNNDHGERVASGVYLYLLTTAGQKKVGKLVVIR